MKSEEQNKNELTILEFKCMTKGSEKWSLPTRIMKRFRTRIVSTKLKLCLSCEQKNKMLLMIKRKKKKI
jgi:hypothetical protein